MNWILPLSFVHKEDDFFESFSGQRIFENFANLRQRCAVSCVGNNNIFIVHTFEKFCKFGYVHMLAGICAAGMVGLVKRAFGYQDFAFFNILQLCKIDELRIAKISNNRQLYRVIDFEALLF